MEASRETLLKELIAYARADIEKAENHKVFKEDDAMERRVTLDWVDGKPTLVHKLSVDGISPAQFQAWCKTYYTSVQKLAPPNVTYQELETSDGGC